MRCWSIITPSDRGGANGCAGSAPSARRGSLLELVAHAKRSDGAVRLADSEMQRESEGESPGPDTILIVGVIVISMHIAR